MYIIKIFSQIILISIFLSSCRTSINKEYPLKNLEKNTSTGLVIGQVQSGKTLSMTAVSAMAKDNNFGIVIVMSGNVTTLSSQTAERFETALEGRNTIKIKNNPSINWSPQDHLTKSKAVLENYKNNQNLEERETILIITHKNPARIDHITELFESLGELTRNVPTLIIDDEADHHSLNSKEYLNDINALSERTRRRRKEIYQIKEGDTLENIAENFSTTVEELKEFNDIETSLEMFGSDINLSDVQIWILGYFIGAVLYTLIEGVTGASPGKRAQKIIIANEDGSEGDFTLFMSRWAIKNISNLMSLLIILTGAISIQWVGSLLGWVVFLGCFLVLASHRQALHDKIVKTAVFNS
mgnify:CR=1 FL=1